jgi:hypothetical protein
LKPVFIDISLWRFYSCCARLVREWLLRVDIGPARPSCNLIKEKSYDE